MNFDSLVNNIHTVQELFQTQAAHAVNHALTARNWLIGYNIVEFEQNGEEINKADVCASFQSEAVDGLVERVIRAAKEYKLNQVCVAGGVAANSYLREKITTECAKNNIKVFSHRNIIKNPLSLQISIKILTFAS